MIGEERKGQLIRSINGTMRRRMGRSVDKQFVNEMEGIEAKRRLGRAQSVGSPPVFTCMDVYLSSDKLHTHTSPISSLSPFMSLSSCQLTSSLSAVTLLLSCNSSFCNCSNCFLRSSTTPLLFLSILISLSKSLIFTLNTLMSCSLQVY